MTRDLGPFVPGRPHKLDAAIQTMLFNALHDHHSGRVFVLQVGAGTGDAGLPLLHRFREAGWSGLLIEPLPQTFARLEALHADSDRVAVLNLGISDISSNLALHTLSPEAEARNRRLPRGRASLIRDRIAMTGTPPEDIQSVEVPFLRMDTVLTELGIDSAQLVVVNAGGHEAQVIASFDLAGLDPSLVFIHATPDTASDAACIATLTQGGLHPFRVGGWLVGLAADRLAIPLAELLTFFGRGLGPSAEDEE